MVLVVALMLVKVHLVSFILLLLLFACEKAGKPRKRHQPSRRTETRSVTWTSTSATERTTGTPWSQRSPETPSSKRKEDFGVERCAHPPLHETPSEFIAPSLRRSPNRSLYRRQSPFRQPSRPNVLVDRPSIEKTVHLTFNGSASEGDLHEPSFSKVSTFCSDTGASKVSRDSNAPELEVCAAGDDHTTDAVYDHRSRSPRTETASTISRPCEQIKVSEAEKDSQILEESSTSTTSSSEELPVSDSSTTSSGKDSQLTDESASVSSSLSSESEPERGSEPPTVPPRKGTSVTGKNPKATKPSGVPRKSKNAAAGSPSSQEENKDVLLLQWSDYVSDVTQGERAQGSDNVADVSRKKRKPKKQEKRGSRNRKEKSPKSNDTASQSLSKKENQQQLRPERRKYKVEETTFRLFGGNGYASDTQLKKRKTLRVSPLVASSPSWIPSISWTPSESPETSSIPRALHF